MNLFEEKKKHIERTMNINMQQTYSISESTWEVFDDVIEAISKYKISYKDLNAVLVLVDNCAYSQLLKMETSFLKDFQRPSKKI